MEGNQAFCATKSTEVRSKQQPCRHFTARLEQATPHTEPSQVANVSAKGHGAHAAPQCCTELLSTQVLLHACCFVGQQRPQSIEAPQPSVAGPQAMPCSPHVWGTHSGGGFEQSAPVASSQRKDLSVASMGLHANTHASQPMSRLWRLTAHLATRSRARWPSAHCPPRWPRPRPVESPAAARIGRGSPRGSRPEGHLAVAARRRRA